MSNHCPILSQPDTGDVLCPYLKNGACLKSSPAEVERVRAFAVILGRRLSPGQLESVLEEWEMVCVKNGWPVYLDSSEPR